MAEIHHRRIELQEQDDLRYLFNNVLQRANEKIDLALPPIEGEDVLRRRVEELVHEYITTTFSTALPNLSINGHPVPISLLKSLGKPGSNSAEEFEYEPRDQKQHHRAAQLRAEEEALLLEVGTLRREAPGVVVEGWRKQFGRVEDVVGREVGPEERREGEGVELGVERLERQEAVERAWGRGVEGLGRLKRELPGTVARMERAKMAGEYVLAES